MRGPISSAADHFIVDQDAAVPSANPSKMPVMADSSEPSSNRPVLRGPFDSDEANELYLACRESGDSPRDAKAAVRRAGY